MVMTREWTRVKGLLCMAKPQIQIWWIQTAMFLLVLRQQAIWLRLLSPTTTTITNRDSHLSSQAVLNSNPLTRSMVTTIPIITTTTITISPKLTWQHLRSLIWLTIITSIQVKSMVVLGSLRHHPITQRKGPLASEAHWEVEYRVGHRLSNRALKTFRRC